MKKLIAILLSALIIASAGCGAKTAEIPEPEPKPEPEPQPLPPVPDLEFPEDAVELLIYEAAEGLFGSDKR